VAKRQAAKRSARGRARRWVWVLLGAVALSAAAVHFWPRSVLRDRVAEEVFAVRLARHAPHFLAAGAESQIDPYVLAAMACVESSVRQRAESSAGALGLLQLRIPTAGDAARRLRLSPPSRDELLDDAQLNVRLGAAYLAWLLPRQEGDLERALMAYNTGPGRFDGWLKEAGGYSAWREKMDAQGAPAPGSVRHYAAKVLDLAAHLRERGALDVALPALLPPQARPVPDPVHAARSSPRD